MDSIFSVRISEELKEKFMDIAQKQGINNKELMEQIIKSYELENVKNDAVELKSHIEELQSISSRIVDIYISMIEGNKIKTLELTNTLKVKIAEEQEKTNKISSQNENLQLKLKEASKVNDELKIDLKEYSTKIASLEVNLKEFKDLNQMLREKNHDLTNELNLFKEYEEKNSVLHKELKTLLKENDELSKSNDKLTSENNHLNKELTFIKESYEIKMNNLEENYKTTLIQKEEVTKINHSTEILHMNQSFNDKILALQNQYEERVLRLVKEKDEEMQRMKSILLKEQ